jgi:hypothetical protein
MKCTVDGGDVDNAVCYVPVNGFSFEILYVLVYDKIDTKMQCFYKNTPSHWECKYLFCFNG